MSASEARTTSRGFGGIAPKKFFGKIHAWQAKERKAVIPEESCFIASTVPVLKKILTNDINGSTTGKRQSQSI